ncbi:MAG: hypothetical protein SFT93_02490 [Rickettsiaceae bacterium]|nr:hypothetical protein [Rickettsiaceae bacterium]
MDKIGQAQDKLIPLGKKIDYSSIYAPHILYPIPRRTPVQILEQNPRQKESDIITYKDEPSLYGYDIWNCYEVSFRNSKYIPQVRILEIYIPCNSPNLIESKSLKLYLFSLSDLVASSDEEFLEIVRNDLELIAGAKIFLKLKKLY